MIRTTVLAAAMAALALPAGAANLLLTTEEFPPYNFVDPVSNKISGIATDMVEALMKATGTTYEIKMLPWQRAYKMGLEDKDTCVYSTTITDERKPLFKWVGPMVGSDWVIFAKPGSPIKLAKLEDAKTYKIGGYKGDAVSQYLAEQGMNMELSTTDRPNPKLLDAGRIDLWASGRHSAPYYAKAEGGIAIEEIFTIKKTDLGLACSKQVDDALIAALNAELEKMRASGELAKIESKYR